jgi:ketosteroid isomerase-like protein
VSKWIADYFDVWNSHDGSRVASFMADDVFYEDVAMGQVHEGEAAIVAFEQRTDNFSKDLQFVSVSEQGSDDRLRLRMGDDRNQHRRGSRTPRNE